MSDHEAPTWDDWRHIDWPSDFTREQLITTYFAHQRAAKGDDSMFWAWEVVQETVSEGAIDDAWALILDLTAAAPDPASLGIVAAGALEDFLREHAEELIDRIEDEAPRNPRLREALAGVWVYPEHVGQELSDRIYAAAESDPGNWPIGASGIPQVAEQLLASNLIEDRRWGAKQVGYDPPKRTLHLELLHSGDEELRETAAFSIAYSRDAELLPDLLVELNAHSGIGGGRSLAWSVDWLAHYAEEDAQRNARAALIAFAARGDAANKRHIDELMNPDLARARVLEDGQELVKTIEDFLDAQEADGRDVSDLREEQAQLWRTIDKLESDLRNRRSRRNR